MILGCEISPCALHHVYSDMKISAPHVSRCCTVPPAACAGHVLTIYIYQTTCINDIYTIHLVCYRLALTLESEAPENLCECLYCITVLAAGYYKFSNSEIQRLATFSNQVTSNYEQQL